MSGLIQAEKCRAFAREASDGELLDQLAFFSEGLEEEARGILRRELSQRGLKPGPLDPLLEEHRLTHGPRVLFAPDKFPRLCAECHRAATHRKLAWVRFFGLIPMFPRWAFFCDTHGGDSQASA